MGGPAPEAVGCEHDYTKRKRQAATFPCSCPQFSSSHIPGLWDTTSNGSGVDVAKLYETLHLSAENIGALGTLKIVESNEY